MSSTPFAARDCPTPPPVPRATDNTHADFHFGMSTSAELTLSDFISPDGNASTSFTEEYDPLRFEQYPWMGYVSFICMYVGSVLTDKLARKLSPKLYVKEMSHSKQRIVCTYVAEIIVTTIAFGYNISCGIPALTGDMTDMTLTQFNHFRITGTMITMLYIWELIYRQEMGAPLLLHHLLTVILIQAFVLDIVQDLDLVRLRQVIFLLFTATSEQTSFIALLYHRFKRYKLAALFFYIAMVSSFLIKSMVYFFCLYLFASSDYITDHDAPNDTFWTWAWVPITTALYGSQVYACYILFSLAKRSERTLKFGENGSTFSQSVQSMASSFDGSRKNLAVNSGLSSGWGSNWMKGKKAHQARRASNESTKSQNPLNSNNELCVDISRSGSWNGDMLRGVSADMSFAQARASSVASEETKIGFVTVDSSEQEGREDARGDRVLVEPPTVI